MKTYIVLGLTGLGGWAGWYVAGLLAAGSATPLASLDVGNPLIGLWAVPLALAGALVGMAVGSSLTRE